MRETLKLEQNQRLKMKAELTLINIPCTPGHFCTNSRRFLHFYVNISFIVRND